MVGSYKAKGTSGMAELFCAGWAALAVAFGMTTSHTWVTPLLVLYFSGFLWMAVLSMRDRYGADAKAHQSAWLLLVPAGLVFVAAAAWIARSPAAWSLSSGPFLTAAATLAAAYLIGLVAVGRRPGNRGTLAWIIIIAILARAAMWPVVPGPDTQRAVVEGRQAAAGINPYQHAPADLISSRVNAVLPTSTLAALEDPDVASVNAPVTVAYARLLTTFNPSGMSFKVMGLLLEALATGLILTLLIRSGRPTSLILFAAWNPLLLLTISGSARPEIAGLALLALGAYLCVGNHLRRGVLALSAAAAATPLAAPALLAALIGERARTWLLAGVALVAAWIPFADSGAAWLRTLADSSFSGGVLPPLLGHLLAPLVPSHLFGVKRLGSQEQLITSLGDKLQSGRDRDVSQYMGCVFDPQSIFN
jgi:hypothetical protein